MKKERKKYKKQKVTFLFDENIPNFEVESLKFGHWKKHFNFISIYEIKKTSSTDEDLFKLCNKNYYVFITKDRDFSDNKKFPLKDCFGIVKLINSKEKLSFIIENFLRFISNMVLPKIFLQESKIKINRYKLIIEKKHITKNEIVKIEIDLKKHQNLEEIYSVIENQFNYPASLSKWEIV